MRNENLPLHKIELPARLHRVSIDEDALRELADSIMLHGLINPITVTQDGDHYQLQAGQRRLLAHERLGRSHIEARVYEPGEPVNGDAVRFAENLQRADLSPMEEARAVRDYANATNAGVDPIAHMVNRSRAWVEQRLALLKLPDELTIALHTKRLGIAHALILAQVDDAPHRNYLLRYALDAGATTTCLRLWVENWKIARDTGHPDTAARPPMPEPGQPIVITVPCHICADLMPYHTARIVRLCADCLHRITDATAPATTEAAP
jgi:ParB family chromosome partitioning protein